MRSVKILFLGLFFSSLLITIKSDAQQNHFVYIQSDDKMPFSVDVNGKTYHASSIGYLIIPKLTTGKYNFVVSFPEKKYPDQQFSCNVENSDIGYALKNYRDKGWGLFNLQSLEIIMAASSGSPAVDVQKTSSGANSFGMMLSQVTNDSSLTIRNTSENSPGQQNIKADSKNENAPLSENSGSNPASVAIVPQVTPQQNSIADSVANIAAFNTPGETSENNLSDSGLYNPATLAKENVNIISDSSLSKAVVNDSAYANDSSVISAASDLDSLIGSNRGNITLLSNGTTETGTSVVFLDQNNGLNDTIKIFIPNNTNIETDSMNVLSKESETASVSNSDTGNVKSNAQNLVIAPFAVTSQANAVPEAKQTQKDNISASEQEINKVNNPFFGTEKKQSADTSAVVGTGNDSLSQSGNNDQSNISSENPGNVIYKTDCKKMISESEMEKLRKKMVAADNDDKMIQAAKKFFEGKCITTAQVKNLGELFLSDSGRYSFFDAAYNYVYDISSYATLGNQLLDAYYKKRFEAMLKY